MQQEQQEGPLVMLFVFVGLLLGSVLREVNKKTKFPYTPMLLVSGLFLGYFRHHLNVVGESTSIIQKLNPEMILFIFIPVLIFESGFNCDWFVFRKAIVNIIILAAPGVLWGAILLGSCFKLILGYTDQELSWYQAFTLGSVLSATDPVAVVALLKELGASVRFNTLIEGQSLLNDGTAMVFFLLFMQLAKGNSSSAGEVFTNFIRIGLGGPLLGIVVGFLASLWLKRIIKDDVLTTNITFVACYLCFYIAEFTWVKVSSILSIVVLGLYMSAVGKTKIYPQSQHSLHVTWTYIQYGCQTLIFLLTGVIIGVQMIEKSTITVIDWVKMFIFWILMQVMRFIMVLTFYPLLRYFGYGLSKKQFVVLVYGGLRGALGLSLALMIGVDHELPQRFRQLTVFYMSGMATITILLNGLTCSKVVNYMEMISNPPVKERLLKSCIKKVEQTTKSKLKELKSHRFLLAAQWRQVEKLISVGNSNQKLQHQQMAERKTMYTGISRNQALEETRFRIMRYIKNLVWEQYQTGECSEDGAKILTQSCDIMLDQTDQKITLWEIASRNFSNTFDIKLCFTVKDYPIIGKIAKSIILNRIYFIYDVSTSLVMACEQAKQQFKQHFPLKKQYLQMIISELEQNIQLAQTYISQLEVHYRMIVLAIHTKKAALMLLTEKKNKLKHMVQQGFIDDSQYKVIRKEIDHQFVNLQIRDFKWQNLTYNEILLECTMFNQLQREQLKLLRQAAAQKNFEAGKTIILRNKQMSHAFIVTSGTVKEVYTTYTTTKGIGNLLTPASIVSGTTSLCVLRAQTDCKLLSIPIEKFLSIMSNNERFQSRILKAAFPSLIKIDETNKLSSLSEGKLRVRAQKSAVVRLAPSENISLENGAYVFKGTLKLNRQLGSNPSLESGLKLKSLKSETQIGKGVIRGNINVVAEADTVLLVFNDQQEKTDRISQLIRQQL